MKTLSGFLSLLVAFALLSGCATTSTNSQDFSALVRPVVGVAVGGLLASSKDPAQRAKYASYLYAAATAIRTAGGGTAPTPQRLEAVINTFLPAGAPEYARLATQLAAQYGAVYIKLPSTDPKLQAYLEQLAEGLEDAAGPWLLKTADLERSLWPMFYGHPAPFVIPLSWFDRLV